MTTKTPNAQLQLYPCTFAAVSNSSLRHTSVNQEQGDAIDSAVCRIESNLGDQDHASGVLVVVGQQHCIVTAHRAIFSDAAWAHLEDATSAALIIKETDMWARFIDRSSTAALATEVKLTGPRYKIAQLLPGTLFYASKDLGIAIVACTSPGSGYTPMHLPTKSLQAASEVLPDYVVVPQYPSRRQDSGDFGHGSYGLWVDTGPVLKDKDDKSRSSGSSSNNIGYAIKILIGSQGSPVLDARTGQWIALHLDCNRGLLISAIVSFLTEKMKKTGQESL